MHKWHGHSLWRGHQPSNMNNIAKWSDSVDVARRIAYAENAGLITTPQAQEVQDLLQWRTNQQIRNARFMLGRYIRNGRKEHEAERVKHNRSNRKAFRDHHKKWAAEH